MKKLMTIQQFCNSWNDDNLEWEHWLNYQLGKDAKDAMASGIDECGNVEYDYTRIKWDTLIVVDYGMKHVLNTSCRARLAHDEDMYEEEIQYIAVECEGEECVDCETIEEALKLINRSREVDKLKREEGDEELEYAVIFHTGKGKGNFNIYDCNVFDYAGDEVDINTIHRDISNID